MSIMKRQNDTRKETSLYNAKKAHCYISMKAYVTMGQYRFTTNGFTEHTTHRGYSGLQAYPFCNGRIAQNDTYLSPKC